MQLYIRDNTVIDFKMGESAGRIIWGLVENTLRGDVIFPVFKLNRIGIIGKERRARRNKLTG